MKPLSITSFFSSLFGRKKNLPDISNPETLYDPQHHGYSHVAVVPQNSTLIFIAGQSGQYAEDGTANTDFRQQVRQTFKNIEYALQSKDITMQHIAKLTTLIVDYNLEKHQILLEESGKIWKDKKFPVNTLIPVSQLALDDMFIEIDAVAVK